MFFRDDSYFGKQEANGTKVFWGRGNGWVLAGIANILELLPKDSGLRPFYVQLFVELAAQLSKLQDDQGFGMPVCLIRIVTRHPKPVPLP